MSRALYNLLGGHFGHKGLLPQQILKNLFLKNLAVIRLKPREERFNRSGLKVNDSHLVATNKQASFWHRNGSEQLMHIKKGSALQVSSDDEICR